MAAFASLSYFSLVCWLFLVFHPPLTAYQKWKNERKKEQYISQSPPSWSWRAFSFSEKKKCGCKKEKIERRCTNRPFNDSHEGWQSTERVKNHDATLIDRVQRPHRRTDQRKVAWQEWSGGHLHNTLPFSHNWRFPHTFLFETNASIKTRYQKYRIRVKSSLE